MKQFITNNIIIFRSEVHFGPWNLFLVHSFFAWLSKRKYMLALAPLHTIHINDTVLNDVVQPGLKSASKFEARQGLVDPYHDILNEIISLITQNIPCLPVDMLSNILPTV